MIRTAEELASALEAHPEAAVSEIVTHSPLWDRALLWLILLCLLSCDWILRRFKGLA